MKNILIFIGIFTAGSLTQAILSRLIGNYWFPQTLETWIFRLLICFLLSIYIFNSKIKNF
jgi:hypothetical protein